jgi:hypothetical protein
VIGRIYGIAVLNKEGIMAFVFGVASVALISYMFAVISYNLLEKKIHAVAEKLTR